MFEDEPGEQQRDETSVSQLLMPTPLLGAEMAFGPAVKMTDDLTTA